MTVGRCKLTGKTGKFVKAHIIPAALTRPSRSGAPLIQWGDDARPIRRRSSWYDHRLVTADGEAILAAYDGWAIKQMRLHKLVWSGWGEEETLTAKPFDEIPGTPWGLRSIAGVDTRKLRLFFLSLLWRAAESELPEFSQIYLGSGELHMLRDMLIKGNDSPQDFFPISLTQLSTRGTIHNQAPQYEFKHVPDLNGSADPVPIFRFYFDGLVVHFCTKYYSIEEVTKLDPQVVGADSTITLLTVRSEKSWQHENFLRLLSEGYQSWPQDMNKFLGPLTSHIQSGE